MSSYKIKHITKYIYAESVYDSINQMMLYPLQDKQQNIISHKIHITDNPTVETFTDKFGNTLGIFSFLSPHTELSIISDLTIESLPVEIPQQSEAPSELWREYELLKYDYRYKDFLVLEQMEYGDEIKKLVMSMLDKSITPFVNVRRFEQYIYNTFSYTQGVTSIETDVDEIWKLKAGVCQDFAHFMLVMLRLVQIPARYVSGYICPKNNEFRGVGATHAWVEAFIPHHGWIGLDPTNNCIASDCHIRLATGRYFKDCTPFKGNYKGKLDHRLEVSVLVENMDENASTFPFIPQDITESIQAPLISEVKSTEQTQNNSYQKYVQMQQQQQQQQ